MAQPLFIEPALEFPKLAAEAALPDDPNKWTSEVLQEAYKQVPYLADFELGVVMETLDGERGYGLGHIEVGSRTEAPMTATKAQLDEAGVRTARIPVIIQDNMLMPLDVVITDTSEALPLTEPRLRQAMFRPQSFDVTGKSPGDQSMIGQLYPPYRQNYGFGGGGVSTNVGMGGKTASATNLPPLLQAVLATANESDLDSFKDSLLDGNVKLAYAKNHAAWPALTAIQSAEPLSTVKMAHAIAYAMKPSVLQICKSPGAGYTIKTASHLAWRKFEERVDRGELVRRCGEKVAYDVDTAGATTVSDDAGVDEEQARAPEDSPGAVPVTLPGMYSVETESGALLTGIVLPNLVDVSGSVLPLALFTDGKHAAVQSDIAGIPAGNFAPPGTVSPHEASGAGVFFLDDPQAPKATIPIEIKGSMRGPGDEALAMYQAETFDGRPVQVSVQPQIQSIMEVDGVMLVPTTWQWLPLSGADTVALTDSPEGFMKGASAAQHLSSVLVRGSGDSYSISGLAVDNLPYEQREFLSQDDAMFLLAGLGANTKYAMAKLAMASTGYRPERVYINRAITLADDAITNSLASAHEQLAVTPVFRQQLWKEAAVITDPLSVDAVLSLGFINPENITTFVGYLPVLDEAQRRMCDLLIGARLGLQELPSGSLERAIRALEDVIEGLKIIAFQGS